MIATALYIFWIEGCGAFSFASYYGSHMVLQRSPKRAGVWGTAGVMFHGDIVSAVLTECSTRRKYAMTSFVAQGPRNGLSTWRILLPPRPAGGPYSLSVTLGSQVIVLSDVLFGDVWLCAGQSNMAMEIFRIHQSEALVQEAIKHQDIRTLIIKNGNSQLKQYDAAIDQTWRRPHPDSIESFSGLCWNYGLLIHQHTGIPVGLITSAKPGTYIESWSSEDALKSCDLERLEKGERGCTLLARDRKRLALVKRARHRHKYDPHRCAPLPGPYLTPSSLWNTMIHPLLNMTMSGILWYQGESNADYIDYDCTFVAFIKDLRVKFSSATSGQMDREFPIGFVQLAPAELHPPFTGIRGTANLRWLQTAKYGYAPNPLLINTFMAVAMDLPDPEAPVGSLHPRDKRTIAERLFLGARAIVFNETGVTFQGPMPTFYKFFPMKYELVLRYSDRVNIRSYRGFQTCCTDDLMSKCHTWKDRRWKEARIIKWTSQTITLDITPCRSRYIVGHRYAWSITPCHYKRCPVYSVKNDLPAPPYVNHDILYANHQWNVLKYLRL